MSGTYPYPQQQQQQEEQEAVYHHATLPYQQQQQQQDPRTSIYSTHLQYHQYAQPHFQQQPQSYAVSSQPSANVQYRDYSHQYSDAATPLYGVTPSQTQQSLNRASLIYSAAPSQQRLSYIAASDAGYLSSSPSSVSTLHQAAQQQQQQSALEGYNDDHAVASPKEGPALTDNITTQLAAQDARFQPLLSNKQQTMLTSLERNRKQYRPYFTILFTTLQVVGLIISFVVQAQVTGSPIMTKPQFNYMIGASPEILVQIGARFVPCMKLVDKLSPNTTNVQCNIPTSTPDPAVSGAYLCTYNDFCGRLAKDSQPDQWYRFVLAIFLHAGLVHFLLNTAFQVTGMRSLEKDWGWWRIGFVYLVSGIIGFVFGGLFSNPIAPSVGSSGALFGIFACLLIDHIQYWRIVHRPWLNLFKMLFLVLISFVLGLLPSIDNFSHVGGFFSGLLAGLVVMPSTGLPITHSSSSRSTSSQNASDETLPGPRTASVKSNNIARRRIPYLNITPFSLTLRLVSLILLILAINFLITSFYSNVNPNDRCTWCKYIDCVPQLGAVFGQCPAN
ncbi:hypothetical protein RI367_002051 [Sorochytrium milnesiophthora]